MTNHHTPGAPRPRHRIRLAGALAAVTLLLAAGCADDAESTGGSTTSTAPAADDASVLGPIDEATGEPVKIGFITDGKSDSADQSVELAVADATTQYINQHLGGIAGRPVELVTCEAKTDPAVSADCANQMVTADVPAVVIGTAAHVDAIWMPLHGAGVPTMFFAGAADGAMADPDSTFTLSDPNAAIIGLPISVAKEQGIDKVTGVIIDVPAALTLYEGEGAQGFADAGIELNLIRVPLGTPDMVPQLQNAIADDPGVVHVLGNDAFCIAAFQALDALAFDGPVTAITQCISDATREALPPESLEGVVVASASPVDANDESDELFRTVMSSYGSDIDTSRAGAHATFSALTGLVVALDALTGDITAESIASTIRAMPESDLPNGGGLTFRCDGNQVPTGPAICVSGGLVTTLDGEGRPTTYTTTQS